MYFASKALNPSIGKEAGIGISAGKFLIVFTFGTLQPEITQYRLEQVGYHLFCPHASLVHWLVKTSSRVVHLVLNTSAGSRQTSVLWWCCNNHCNGPWNGHRLSCYAESGRSAWPSSCVNSSGRKSFTVGLFWKPYWKSWVLMGLKDPWYSRLVCLNGSHDCHKAVINHHARCLAKAVVGGKTAEHMWACVCVWNKRTAAALVF